MLLKSTWPKFGGCFSQREVLLYSFWKQPWLKNCQPDLFSKRSCRLVNHVPNHRVTVEREGEGKHHPVHTLKMRINICTRFTQPPKKIMEAIPCILSLHHPTLFRLGACRSKPSWKPSSCPWRREKCNICGGPWHSGLPAREWISWNLLKS